jgi:protein subunit release factor A
LHSLDYVMDGDIEQLIDALVNEDQRLKLEGSGL